MAETSRPAVTDVGTITTFSQLAIRIAWVFAGPVALAFIAITIASTRDGWLTTSDLAFLIVLVATVSARWIGFRNGDRANTLGELTTQEQMRRYSINFSAGGIALWASANLFANTILSAKP